MAQRARSVRATNKDQESRTDQCANESSHLAPAASFWGGKQNFVVILLTVAVLTSLSRLPESVGSEPGPSGPQQGPGEPHGPVCRRTITSGPCSKVLGRKTKLCSHSADFSCLDRSLAACRVRWLRARAVGATTRTRRATQTSVQTKNLIWPLQQVFGGGKRNYVVILLTAAVLTVLSRLPESVGSRVRAVRATTKTRRAARTSVLTKDHTWPLQQVVGADSEIM